MWKKDGETAGSIIPSTDGAKDGEIIAFVGKGVTFRGAISYEGTVRIDGRVDGEIQTSGTLVVGEEAVITAKDVSTIYEVPLALRDEGLDSVVLKYLHLPPNESHMQPWEELVHRIKNPEDEITIHVVGKYTGYEDS